MPRKNDNKIQADTALKQLVTAMPQVTMDPERFTQLESWLAETIETRRRERADRIKKIDKYRKTLSGERVRPAPRRGASNISVPLSIWAAAGARARVDEGTWGQSPILSVKAAGPPETALANAEDAKELQRWLETALLSPTGLNARTAGAAISAESTNYGTSALKVYVEPDDVKILGPRTVDGSPSRQLFKGQPRWEYVSFDDLIYWNGYGRDTQRMPYIGHEFDRTWSDIMKWVGFGWYDEKRIKEIKAFFEDKPGQGSSAPAGQREHRVVELYLDYIVDSSNIPHALLVDFHLGAKKIMRVAWNPTPLGIRPIFINQFDINPDPKRAEGQGVCEKLEGAQDETDEIHNIGIEAGKRAAAFLIGLRYGSQAETELGGGRPVMPGDTYTSENPEEDVTTKPLGDPKAAEAAIGIEGNTRLYVMRILGFDEARLGNVQSGKRVPSSLGLPIMREGKVVIQHALNSFADLLTDGMYLTLELFKRHFPEASMRAVMSARAVERFKNVILAPEAPPVRDAFVIRIVAQDAAAQQEAKKQDMIVLTQYLLGLFDKLTQYAAMTIQMPPELQPVMTEIIKKLENSVRLLLSTMESVQNPEEVLPEVSKILKQLQDLGSAVSGGGNATRVDDGEGGDIPDLGGGVT